MSELSSYTYFMFTAKLTLFGFIIHREIDINTEEWINPATGRKFSIKQLTGLLTENEAIDILNQADITIKEFMDV